MMALFCMYYGPLLIINQFGFDIYTSSTLLNIAEALTYIPWPSSSIRSRGKRLQLPYSSNCLKIAPFAVLSKSSSQSSLYLGFPFRWLSARQHLPDLTLPHQAQEYLFGYYLRRWLHFFSNSSNYGHFVEKWHQEFYSFRHLRNNCDLLLYSWAIENRTSLRGIGRECRLKVYR